MMQITLQTATLIRFLQQQIAATAFGCIEGRTFSEGFFDNVQLKSITEARYDHGMLFFTCKTDRVYGDFEKFEFMLSSDALLNLVQEHMHNKQYRSVDCEGSRGLISIGPPFSTFGMEVKSIDGVSHHGTLVTFDVTFMTDDDWEAEHEPTFVENDVTKKKAKKQQSELASATGSDIVN